MFNKSILILFTVFIFFSCQSNEPKAEITFSDDLTVSNNGWLGDFADYPVGEEVFYELQAKRASLPAELNTNKMALLLTGNNHSDDLFMFMKKQIDGLQANKMYNINFEVDFATNAAAGGLGIGGSPSASVYFGMGASPLEPQKIKDADNFYKMNVNKINQAQNGKDMIVVGDISNGLEDYKYKMVKRSGSFKAQSDSNGKLWLIIGTDSGFEGTTSLYYTHIKTTLQLAE